jgi:hypothetical protein
MSLAGDLGLAKLRRERLADDLAQALAAANVRAAQGAATALRMYGLRLGTLITTLRDPQTAARQADTPSRQAFLAQWPAIDAIWLAGGLLAKPCGGLILEAVRAVTAQGPRPCRIALSPFPASAALIGAARRTHLECPDGMLAVADLGQTCIKTAAAQRSGNLLRRFRLLDRYPAPDSRSATDVEEVVAVVLGRVVRQAASPGARRICLTLSIASFVAKGEPVDDGHGTYGRLSGRMAPLLRRIKTDTGVSADLELVHDGTAAASAVESPNSATITAGTWLAVGFQPIDGPRLLELRSRAKPPRSCARRVTCRVS